MLRKITKAEFLRRITAFSEWRLIKNVVGLVDINEQPRTVHATTARYVEFNVLHKGEGIRSRLDFVPGAISYWTDDTHLVVRRGADHNGHLIADYVPTSVVGITTFVPAWN